MRFSVVQQSDTAQLTFTFNSAIDISESGPCFLNKFIFIDIANQARRLQPSFGGYCNAAAMTRTVTAMLDIRDYAAALTEGVFVGTGVSLITVSGSENGFLPGVSLDPIMTPLVSASLTAYTNRPTLESFDVDLAGRKILLHFSDIMSLGSLRSNFLTLLVPGTDLSHQLTTDTRPIGVEANNVKTICLTLSPPDLTGITSQSICINRERCYITFDGLLAANYVRMGLEAPATDIQVRHIVTISLATLFGVMLCFVG